MHIKYVPSNTKGLMQQGCHMNEHECKAVGRYVELVWTNYMRMHW